MSNRHLAIVATLSALAACASKPPPVASEVPSDRYAVELRRGDLVSITLMDESTSSFCVAFVDAEGIHEEGVPRVVPLAKIQKLTNSPGGCFEKRRKSSGAAAVGEVAGLVVVAPFIIVCMLAGGCDTK